MKTFGILFYTVVSVLIGLLMLTFAIVFSFDVLQPQCITYITNLLEAIKINMYYRLAIGVSGGLLMLLSFYLSQIILARFQREKTIAFSTSSGEVTIALSAVEDLIRRLAVIMPEIKELRPDVIATKKGILVDLRVTLRSEANIPELTSRLQDITRSKIQEVLGLEEQIIIKIHIAKIISAEEKEKRKKDLDKQETVIPFGGYGRV